MWQNVQNSLIQNSIQMEIFDYLFSLLRWCCKHEVTLRPVLGMNCTQKQAEDQLTNWQVVQADMD